VLQQTGHTMGGFSAFHASSRFRISGWMESPEGNTMAATIHQD
jgi:hypothetical protein